MREIRGTITCGHEMLVGKFVGVVLNKAILRRARLGPVCKPILYRVVNERIRQKIESVKKRIKTKN